MTGPRPSEAFPAVDPARDLPAAVELIRRVAAERHPYDAVLLGMAAEVLEVAPPPVDEHDPCVELLARALNDAMDWDDPWLPHEIREHERWHARNLLARLDALRATTPNNDPGPTIRARAATEAANMCCRGTGECGIGPDCGQDRARLDALNEAADWTDALTAPAETEVVIEAFARHRHEATGRDKHNGRNIRPDGDARGASPIGLCTWAEAPEDWREGYRELCRHDAGLVATSPAQGEAEAFAFLDGMYAIREDEVDPDYAARKWAQRGHVTPDEEDRAIVARMLGRAAPAPTASRAEDDRGVDRGDPARYWSTKTEAAGGER